MTLDVTAGEIYGPALPTNTAMREGGGEREGAPGMIGRVLHVARQQLGLRQVSDREGVLNMTFMAASCSRMASKLSTIVCRPSGSS